MKNNETKIYDYERPEIIDLNSRVFANIAYVRGASCLPDTGGFDIGGEEGGGDL